jgi:uncharacterized protein (DUF2461 family)
VAFRGFNRGALELLRVLPGLDAQGYAEHRERLEEGLIQPGKDLIGQFVPLLELKPFGLPKSSVSPLHTDLRFSPAGSPRYKDHLLLTAFHGPDKKTGVTMWIRIDADNVSFACGMAFTAQGRERWRRGIAAETGRELVEAMKAIEAKHREHGFEIQGEMLKRPPAPWAEDHPRAAYLRRTGFQLRFTEPLPDVELPSFFGWSAERVGEMRLVYHWLVANMLGRRPTSS